jgi:hypothetical protein
MGHVGWALLIKRTALCTVAAAIAGCAAHYQRYGPPPSPGMPPVCSDDLFKDDPECVRQRQNSLPAQPPVSPNLVNVPIK